MFPDAGHARSSSVAHHRAHSRTTDCTSADLWACWASSAVNLTFLPSISPPPYEEYAKVIIDEGVKIAETAGGPAALPIVKQLVAGGVQVIHKVTATRHAKAAEAAGASFISVDGFECAVSLAPSGRVPLGPARQPYSPR